MAVATRPRHRPDRSTDRAAWAGLLGVGATVVAVGLMHLVAPWSRHDPVRRTISEYAVGPGGWAFDAAVVVLVASSALVTAALVRHRVLAARGLAVALLGVWCVGLVLVVVFEKTNWSIGPSVSGSIHRYASLAAFLALPAAGLLTARRLHSAPLTATLRGLSLAAYACFVPIVVAIAVRPWTGTPWWRAIPLGLLERGVALAEVGVVVVLAVLAVRRGSTSHGDTAPRE